MSLWFYWSLSLCSFCSLTGVCGGEDVMWPLKLFSLIICLSCPEVSLIFLQRKSFLWGVFPHQNGGSMDIEGVVCCTDCKHPDANCDFRLYKYDLTWLWLLVVTWNMLANLWTSSRHWSWGRTSCRSASDKRLTKLFNTLTLYLNTEWGQEIIVKNPHYTGSTKLNQLVWKLIDTQGFVSFQQSSSSWCLHVLNMTDSTIDIYMTTVEINQSPSSVLIVHLHFHDFLS